MLSISYISHRFRKQMGLKEHDELVIQEREQFIRERALSESSDTARSVDSARSVSSQPTKPKKTRKYFDLLLWQYEF